MQSFANTETNYPFFLSTFSYFLSSEHRISSHRQFTPDQAVLKEKVLFPWICKNSMSESGIFTSQQYQVCLSTSSLSLPTQLISLYLLPNNIKQSKLGRSQNDFLSHVFTKKWKKNEIHNHVNNIKVKHKVEWRDIVLEKLFSLEFPQWIRAVEMCSHYHK